MKLTNNIKILRAEEDLTQEELAKKAGVTRQTIISIEQGRYVPSLILSFKIAIIFNKKISQVWRFR
jgi:putative transcriptional regulator